jgi:hypothetical protein
MGIYLAVALGGAAGAMSRFGIDQAIERRSFAVFPGDLHDQRQRLPTDRAVGTAVGRAL